MNSNNSISLPGENTGASPAPMAENNSIKGFLGSALQLIELNETEQRELQKLAATIFIMAQKRKNEKAIISGIESEIGNWQDSAQQTTSLAEKVKVTGIIDSLKRDLQIQKLGEARAAGDLQQAYSNFNLFKVKISIANPQARKGLDEFREKLQELLVHLPNLVRRSER